LNGLKNLCGRIFDRLKSRTKLAKARLTFDNDLSEHFGNALEHLSLS